MMRLVLLAALVISPLCSQAQDKPDAPPPPKPQTQPNQAELEKKFEELLTNCVMVGRFTTRGRDENPREDRYTILSAKRLLGERWVITAKIQYRRGADAVAIPIIVPVKWAGDTPVISITDMTIPGMGTYSARVMFYKNEYSGMWDAGDHGGLMWGRIERAAADPAQAPSPIPAPAK